jgi:ribosomal protein S27AE
MKRQDRRAERWEEFEEWVQGELEKARRRFLLAASFDEIEEIVVGLGQEFEREMMAVGAMQRERQAGKRMCPKCGAGMRRNGRMPRQLKTSRGAVRFERERWTCPECGTNVFPPG